MEVSLTGNRALITAGAAGIGRATAEAMAASGARVHICDIDEAAVQDVREAQIPGISATVAIGLTKSLAIELGRDAIRVNAVCPGPVEGPPIDRAISSKAISRGVTEEEVREEYLSQATMHRITTAQEVASLIVFLCSDFSRSISGQVIGVDGNILQLK